MSSSATTICKVFSNALLAALLMAPSTLLADRWDSSNNPSRFHSEAKPKKPATTKKTNPKEKNLSNDRHYEVKTDSRGRSTVRFGDGQTGRRLPRGQRGITGRYRQSKSASSPSTTTKPKKDIKKIDKKK